MVLEELAAEQAVYCSSQLPTLPPQLPAPPPTPDVGDTEMTEVGRV